MTKRLTFERFTWFHKRIKDNRFPNSRHLVEEFEISERTAHRDIEFMRERLYAPLEYHPGKKGYFYNDTSFEMPTTWITEDKILALVLAFRLASTIPDRAMKEDLCHLLEQVLGPACNENHEKRLDRLDEKISVKNIEYSRINEQFFHQTVQALFNDQPLLISYHSPYNGQTTTRRIQPLHLMQYMGNWHLLAWCTSRNALRNFALARMTSVEATKEIVTLPEKLPSVKEYTRRHFGIIQGASAQEVTLRFSAGIAPRIREQIWHPEQKMEPQASGELLLSFPVGDFRELVRVILSHGTEVRVVKPLELQQQVRKEIETMYENYQDTDVI